MAKSSKYVKFSFPISAYQPDALQQGYSEKELRKEYSRLRDVAQKRIKRMGQTEWKRSQTYKYNVDRYKKVRDITSTSELTHLMSDMARFLTASRGGVQGLEINRQRILETMHTPKAGSPMFDFVNESNWWDWVDFIEWVKDFAGFSYDAGKVKDVFKQAQEEGWDLEKMKTEFRNYQANKPSEVPTNFDE